MRKGTAVAINSTADQAAVPEPRDGHQADLELSHTNGPIGALIDATYQDAVGSSDGTPVWGYRAVARLSGHLAAMQRIVYPAASRRLGEDQHRVRRCRAEARETAWALRVLQSHLSGDGGGGARLPGPEQLWLGECLAEYRLAEQALIAWMHERLTVAEGEQLALGYRAALRRAPTRPHPRGPHSGWPGRMAFRLHVVWDGVLDGVDSRPGIRRPD
jgi:hypothetical protein